MMVPATPPKPWVLAALIGLLCASPAAAQDRPVEVYAGGGGAVPRGEVADFLETGPSARAGVRVAFTDRLSAVGELGAQVFGGETETLGLLAQGGVAFELLPASPLSASVEALAGYIAYESEEESFSATIPCPCPPEAAFLGSGATLGGGLRVGYRVSSQLTIGFRGTVHHFPAAGGGPTGVGQYDGATTIPLQFNVSFRP